MDRADQGDLNCRGRARAGLCCAACSHFITVMGVGPKARLTHIRLERARASLLMASGRQVTAIALDYRVHPSPSRFAGLFPHTYGERPSETLARKRRLPDLSTRCSA